MTLHEGSESSPVAKDAMQKVSAPLVAGAADECRSGRPVRHDRPAGTVAERGHLGCAFREGQGQVHGAHQGKWLAEEAL